ncbi:MAG: Sjogren's syndrome/scleroderma autoantigen 1 family protein [Candidatus Hodarchaeota archaeon]
MEDKKEDDKIKKMAEMLKQGYTMTSDICPSCNSPLFLKNDLLFCPSCNKQVIKISDDREAISIIQESMLSKLNEVINNKIEDLTQLIENEKDTDNLNSYLRLLIAYLETIERIKRITKSGIDKS